VSPIELELVAEVRRAEIAGEVAWARRVRAALPTAPTSAVRVRAGRALVGLGHALAPELRPA